jgi:hypothetical protein
MNFRPSDTIGAEAIPFVSAVPSSFLKLSDRLQQCCSPRQLGYFGQDRFVMFYFEPRGGEVVWTDSRSCGFGTGAWQVFLDEIEPVARLHGVNIGSAESRGQHGLIIDREWGQAYFAGQREGRVFLAQQRPALSA